MRHTNRGYWRIKTSDGWRYEHNVVAEAKYGRKLKPGEVVHHIDGNCLNNEIDNIIILTRSEHTSLHASNPSPITRYRKSLSKRGELNPMFGKRGELSPIYGKPGAFAGKSRPEHSKKLTKWHIGDIHFRRGWGHHGQGGLVIRIAHGKDMSFARYQKLAGEKNDSVI